ncbi:MAG: T9SS type A sorting domain-containing protein [Saprospiraceae bacterium]|nr:T9SS type A sorting domain-containing protein [Saprospiraceae bacterium]
MLFYVALILAFLDLRPESRCIESPQNYSGSCSRFSDSTILVQFYYATNGLSWTTPWNLNKPMNEWSGVLLNPSGCVQSLVLINNNVNGILLPELGMLSDLRIFYLFGNELTGPIPPELGQLTKLEDLVLEDNALTGTIPKELSQCISLKNISLANNQLTGSIPEELGILSNLVTLNLSKNQLTGSVPASLSALNKLSVLDISQNMLSGEIPQAWSQLTALRELYLQFNLFTGILPASFSGFTQMNHFWVYNNDFTGRVPDLTSAPLFSMRIENNRFSDIPDFSGLTTWGNSFPFGLVIFGNKFTFEDLIPLKKLPRRYYYSFNPQDPIDIDSIIFVDAGTNYTVQTFADPTLNDNNYKWFKDTSVVFISNQNTFEIIQASSKDEAYYSGRITNPEINDFEILIDTFRVVVFNALECDKPLAGNECKEALGFCSTIELHNYCGSLGVIDTSLHYFLCDTMHPVYNPRWLSFVAPTDSIIIEILPINCSGVEDNGIFYRGMQAALWQSCGARPDSILICKSECKEGPILIEFGEFIVGNKYQLALNGCHGDNCSYVIKIRKGFNNFELNEPAAITGDLLICPGNDEHVYSIYTIPGAESYMWYLNDSLMASTSDSFTILKDLNPGTYQLKVRAVNFCDTTSFSLITLNVNPQMFIRNVDIQKIASDSAFVVSFDIEGGIKPYTVSKGRGKIDSITGNFISDILLCKSSYEFEISDSNKCIIVFKGFENCGCLSQAGAMPMDTLQICEGQSFTVKFIGTEVQDPNDLSTYIIFTDLINPTTSIIKNNVNGIFPFDPARFRFNVWYHVARVVGRKNNMGGINFNHPCLSISNIQPLIFRQRPLVSAGLDQNICGYTTTLNSFGSYTSGVWKFVSGPGTSIFSDSTNSMTSVTVSEFGTYTFIHEVSNGFCANKDEIKITFREGLMPIPSGFLFVCEGQSTQLDAGNYHKYVWSTGDTSRKVIIDAPGTYCITVSDENNCTGSNCFDVELSVAPTVQILRPDSICVGNLDTLSVAQSFFNYSWSDSSNLAYLLIDSGGNYCLTVTGFNGCTDTDCVEVFSKPRSFGIFQDTVCFGLAYTFRNQTFLEPGNYDVEIDGAAENGCDSIIRLQLNWWPEIFIRDSVILKDNGNGTGAISITLGGGKGPYNYLWSNGARTSSITNLRAGPYTLFATDVEGCIKVFTVFVQMVTSTYETVRNQTSGQYFKVFPNPSSKKSGLYIQNLEHQGLVHLQVYNSLGHLIDKQTFVSFQRGEQRIYNKFLVNGFYYLVLMNEEGHTNRFRVVVND